MTMNLVKPPVWIIVMIHIFLFGTGNKSPSFVFGNSSYTFYKKPPKYNRDWNESRERCKKIGSDLVSIESEKEWFFLKETIQNYATGEYFIGLRNVSKSKGWRWISDNSKVSATKGEFPWAKDEPNGDGNCAVMYKDYRNDYGLFFDLNCTKKRPITGYICESTVDSDHQEGSSDGDKRCSCYTFEIYKQDSPKTWVQAYHACKFKNSYLVVMETEREWEFINKEIQIRQSRKNDEWFIGLYRNLTTGNWTWLNRKPLTIDKWQYRRPKNTDFFSLMAKEWPSGMKGSFNSINLNVHRGWICEEETDNCQGVCMIHNPLQTTTTAPIMTNVTTISSGTSPGDERCSCYTFENDRLISWPLALASCKLINKDLVVIETQREWKFITMKIQTRKSGKHDEWHIGLYKSLITGNWTWINGKALTIDKWQENTPDDNNSYTLMAKEWPTGFKGSFKSIKEDTARGWICEEVTDNCQGVCLSDNLEETTATSSLAIASESTASHPTRDPEDGKQAYEKDNYSLSVIILGSLVAVLSVALFIFGVCFLSWRKTQLKDTRKATDTGNQIDNQDGSLLSPENAARELGFFDEPEPHVVRLEYQRQGTDQDLGQECEYTMLTPHTMMVPGDSSYASLAKSKQEECTNGSSVAAASPLLQRDTEPHDELPKYINVRSANHI